MRPNFENFKIIAQDYGFEETIPEKDYWVIYLIKKMSELSLPNGYLVFGGGTSLVKAHRVIKRFSEDIDFRFITDISLNRSQRSKIKHIITGYLKTLNPLFLFDEPEAHNENTLLFFKLNYPRDERFNKNNALRPFIKLEIFFSDIHYPPIKCPLISFYNEYEHLQPEVEFNCVAIEDTAIDKISSLLWRIEVGEYEPTDIRHLHDVAMLCDKITIDDKFKKTLNVVYNKDIRTRAKSDKELKVSIDTVTTNLMENKRYAYDYKNYVSNMSYAPDSDNLSFEQARDKFVQLAEKIAFEPPKNNTSQAKLGRS
ncbi:MAG: nucleotidyl transferase AbiEii/AbiGii toxin family protein [Chitinispirillales bacterium]|jgi:predicted nucleotidyltransferase component of viral defense system|nr:nucleotidyl transferase AbiEii/AbiGii toxin family protein [Chitinispirillales bacterium]